VNFKIVIVSNKQRKLTTEREREGRQINKYTKQIKRSDIYIFTSINILDLV
jgi:hypothetical protein